jgi:hypothetical protein
LDLVKPWWNKMQHEISRPFILLLLRKWLTTTLIVGPKGQGIWQIYKPKSNKNYTYKEKKLETRAFQHHIHNRAIVRLIVRLVIEKLQLYVMHALRLLEKKCSFVTLLVLIYLLVIWFNYPWTNKSYWWFYC